MNKDNPKFPINMNTSNTFPNVPYGPAGYNDSNFNRNVVPSNNTPFAGGMMGSPFSRFNPMSTNMQYNMNNMPNMSSFDAAFQQHDPMIEKINYMNQNHLLHNNVGDPVYAEDIIEYRINIDSLDRDIKVYPNPFDFIVRFDASAGGSVRTEIERRGKLIAIDDCFKGAPGPLINKNFRNVKFIKLDSVVLPQNWNIVKCHDKGFIIDTSSRLPNERFIILSIDELDKCDRTYSTSDNGLRVEPKSGHFCTPPVPFSLIFPDTLIGTTYYTGIPFSGHRIFKNGQLGNISKLHIKFYDSFGVPLHIDNLFKYTDLVDAAKNGDPISINDVRHPLNKNIQVHLSFIFGVAESQITTANKFER